MDNTTEPNKPPLLLPEPEKHEAPAMGAEEAPDIPADDLAEETEIEPREEGMAVEEIEQLPRERQPAGRQGGQGRHDRGGRRDHRDNRDHRDHHGSHRPRPFVTDSRHRGHNHINKDAKREILVNCSPEETRVAVLENNTLIELLIER